MSEGTSIHGNILSCLVERLLIERGHGSMKQGFVCHHGRVASSQSLFGPYIQEQNFLGIKHVC